MFMRNYLAMYKNLFKQYNRRITINLCSIAFTYLTKDNHLFQPQQLIIIAVFGARDEKIASRIGGSGLGLLLSMTAGIYVW